VTEFWGAGATLFFLVITFLKRCQRVGCCSGGVYASFNISGSALVALIVWLIPEDNLSNASVGFTKSISGLNLRLCSFVLISPILAGLLGCIIALMFKLISLDKLVVGAAASTTGDVIAGSTAFVISGVSGGAGVVGTGGGGGSDVSAVVRPSLLLSSL
jgi:hypothetical protein